MTTPSIVGWDDAGVWRRSGFAAFLDAHGIQRSDLIAPDGRSERRFMRTTRQLRESETPPLTDAQIEARVMKALAQCERLPWLPGFFSLPASTPLASLDLYQRGEIHGMDSSSGYAVTLLDVQPGDHVLDLCCAPGAKLTMIADLLRRRGSVTGVDFSRSRIGACQELVHKYQLVDGSDEWRCRLFHADGRSFGVGPMSEHGNGVFEVVLDTHEIRTRDAKSQSRKRKNKSARAREAKRLKEAASQVVPADEEAVTVLYDKVLVDAECTHDGSIKHLQKLETEDAWTAYVADHLNDAELERIRLLQRALIRNGFALVRTGGTMIYSTCSLSLQQNEAIVREFLDVTPTAELLPIDTTGIPCETGKIDGTVRFTPAHATSGLFIAKIRKIEGRTE